MGYLQVYTGDGKGKTSAAYGAALRAYGQGRSVFMAQFLKHRPSGEALAWERLTGRPVELYGAPRKVGSPFNDADRLAAEEGWRRVERALSSHAYDVIVLDELCVALGRGLLNEAGIIEALGAALAGVERVGEGPEIICTGRDAPSSIIALAGLVTESRCRKHYAAAGQAPRLGLEY